MDKNEVQSSLVRETFIDPAIEYATHHITEFGNAFLDDALTGILPNDLVLIGAKSGVGKTQIATQIAGYNVTACKKQVVFIALEAEPNEIEMRLRYAIEAGLFFRDQNRDRSVIVNYRKWRLGLLVKELARYKEQAITLFIQRFSGLHTVYRGEHYGIEDLERTLDECKDVGELFILDHIHFMDMDGNNSNEMMSRLMKKIRNMNLRHNKPFIALGHLKKDIHGVVPQLEDFMGSSDIGKIATMAIMLAKDPEGYDAKNQTQRTIISIPKSRTGGLGNLVGVAEYSIQHQGYLPNYNLAKVLRFRDSEKIEAVSIEEAPDWAKRIKLPTQAKVQTK